MRSVNYETYCQGNSLVPLHSETQSDTNEQTLTQFKPKLKKPSMYKVLLLNDDFTPMDFVILVLKRFFRKSEEESTKIMLQVHQQGAGIAGVYSHEIAETKVYMVNEFAQSHQYPLKCVMEEETANSSPSGGA